MKKLLIIIPFILLTACGSKGNKENHGSGIAVPWCENSYIEERNKLVQDLNLNSSLWRIRSTYGGTIDRQELEDLLARTAKFLNTHENTVCRGNVMHTCDTFADFGCQFEYKEENINNSELVSFRNTLTELLVGSKEE
ncbi:MAG: hypothetical protein EP326_08620 [Deltaproteobacteria bacterium]|nr:MAG: hypothetical protein EP326_08620 [Deltaproteobacteria bacterium]